MLAPNGIVNNASYSSNPLAPGTLAAIFGSNLTDGSSCVPPACNPVFGPDGVLGTIMAGAQVNINGAPVPILNAAPDQLDVQIPTELTGTSAVVQVSVRGQSSSPQTISLTPVSPGIFTLTFDGRGNPAAVHTSGTVIDAQHPARVGELISLFGTGLGQVTPAVPTGKSPVGSTTTVASFTVIVDGKAVTPDYVGLANCCVGLNQINFRLPPDTKSGSLCLVVVMAGGTTAGSAADPCSLAAGAVASNEVTLPVQAADVLQHHLSSTRNGLYTDPLITRQAAARTHRDATFNAPLSGPVYGQPLYVENGPGGKSAFIVATEQNNVVAIDAATGAQLWSVRLGNPVALSQLPCGNIDPVGITSTPVVDVNSRTVYVAGMSTPDGGATKQHRVFALSLDTGATLPGWPFEVNGVTYGGFTFKSSVQNQRGALLLNGGYLYVPYGGLLGDCGSYNGWVIAIPINNPQGATAWATGARGGGIWGPGGLASDGNSIFAATGNTFGANTWMGGEAIVRLGAGATFSGSTADFFSPSNWHELDVGDADIGGTGPILLDVPGATPSQFALALGKNGVAYLLDRNSLGGIGTGNGIIGEGVRSQQVATGGIINAPAAYRAPSGTYVVFYVWGNGVGCPGAAGNLVALKIGATSPPSIDVAWCADNQGAGSPMVTTIDGTSQPVVWTAGSEGSNRLHAFDGETGQLLFAGGGQAEQMGLVRRYETPIAVTGRIVVAGDNGLYVFSTQ